MLTDKELYEGFDQAAIDHYETGAEQRWGGTDAYAQSRKRVRALSKADWAIVKVRGQAITLAFKEAFAAGADPEGSAAQALAGRWVDHLHAFYDPTPEIIAGLGAMYADDSEFRAFYDKIAIGLADWLKPCLAFYALSLK